jgi:hypothetical protein
MDIGPIKRLLFNKIIFIMKKLTLLFVCLMLSNMILYAQDTLVFWNFKTAPYDTLADGGNAFNISDLISRDTSWHGKFTYSSGALATPDKCISSTSWAGGNGIKYYQIGFSSISFGDLSFYSRQRSSGTGPKYFKVQYRITSAGVWTDIAGSNVTCADNFTTGTLTGITLPIDCNNQADLYLRWVMTSDSSVGGALVGAGGTSRIDEIYILAATQVGIDEQSVQDGLIIIPNPCDGSFTLQNLSDAEVQIEVLDITGKNIYSQASRNDRINISIPDIEPGLYFVRTTGKRNHDIQTRKLVVR